MSRKFTKILMIAMLILSTGMRIEAASISTIDIRDADGNDSITGEVYSTNLDVRTFRVYKIGVNLSSDITGNAQVVVEVPEQLDISSVGYEQTGLTATYIESEVVDEVNRTITYKFNSGSTGQFELVLAFKITMLLGLSDNYSLDATLYNDSSFIADDTYDFTDITLLLKSYFHTSLVNGSTLLEDSEVLLRFHLGVQGQAIHDATFKIPLPEDFTYLGIENRVGLDFNVVYDSIDHALILTDDYHLAISAYYIEFKLKTPSISAPGATDTYDWKRVTNVEYEYKLIDRYLVNETNAANVNGYEVMEQRDVDTVLKVVDELPISLEEYDVTPTDFHIGANDEILYQYGYDNTGVFDADDFVVEYTFGDPLRVRTLSVGSHFDANHTSVKLSYKTNLNSLVQVYNVTSAKLSPHPTDDLGLATDEYLTWVELELGTIEADKKNGWLS